MAPIFGSAARPHISCLRAGGVTKYLKARSHGVEAALRSSRCRIFQGKYAACFTLYETPLVIHRTVRARGSRDLHAITVAWPVERNAFSEIHSDGWRDPKAISLEFRKHCDASALVGPALWWHASWFL